MKKRVVYFFITIFVLNACNNNEDNSLNPKQIDLVTGINLVNDFGLSIGRIGNPNDFSNNGVSVSVSIYPNPFAQRITINSTNKLKNVWVIKGVKTNDFQSVDFSTIINNDLYSENEISSKSIKEFVGLTNNKLIINSSSLDKGFYKVFIQLEDNSIFWTNIYKGNIDDINVW